MSYLINQPENENNNNNNNENHEIELANQNQFNNNNLNNNNNTQNPNSNLPYDKKNAYIKMFFTANRDQEIRLNIKQQAIWKGFPLSDRILYSFFCGSKCLTDNKSNLFLIDEMLQNKCTLDERIDFQNKYLSLKILKTGTFDIEPCIIHPYVKVSIVNLKTGKYLQKADFEVPAILQHEKNLVIQHNSAQNILEFRESALDYLPPVATNPCDLRIKGESYAEWNEELIINDAAENIFQSENVIFFEILDFNLFQNAYSSMREYASEQFIFPIAWGYLKPVGFSQTYLGKYKIQLYKYIYKRTDLMKKLKLTNNSFTRTPDVLFEFNWFKKQKYQTYLEVELNIETKPSADDLTKEFYIRKYKNSVFLSEAELNLQQQINALDLNSNSDLLRKMKSKFEQISEKEKQRKLLLAKRRRLAGEDCVLPDKLLFKFETGGMGVLTQAFSPNGKYLAVACAEQSSLTTLKVFNVEDGKLSFHLRGHINLVHSLSWSVDSSILVSAGSDNNVILWQIPQDDSNNSDNFDYLDNDKIFKLTNITHPSYVYSTAILPEESKDMIILATACFDGFVRIYTVNFILEPAEQAPNLGSKSPMKDSNAMSPKGLRGSGSNFYRSLSVKGNQIPKKTFAKYVLVSQIAINEEFLNQDFFLSSKSNWNNQQQGKGAAPLSQTQFYQAEKEKSKFSRTNNSNNNNNKSNNSGAFSKLANTIASNFKQANLKDTFDRRTDEYLKRMHIKKEDFNNLNEEEKTNLIEKTVLEHRHPNSLFFDELGKLYIGDSLGAIHIWEFRIINAKAVCNKIRVLTHKEIEGDDINKLYIEPGPKRRLIVHSRDNCIRLLDISKEKPKVIVRYYGLKCSKMNVKSAVSPDGNYIISGSEDGKFYLWSLFSGTPMQNTKYECEFVDPVVDVCWSNCYNMFAVSGFGRNYPVLVYVHERQEIGFEQLEYKLRGEEDYLNRNKSNDYYDLSNNYAFNRKENEKVVSAFRDNFSDFSKEFKGVIEPQIKK